MHSRERLLAVLAGRMPDRVPVAPDFSNMIPARLTGKPFWDIYFHRDPPIWDAYIDCVKRFQIDSLMDGHFSFDWDWERPRPDDGWRTYSIPDNEDRLILWRGRQDGGKMEWAPTVAVCCRADPPAGVAPAKIGLPPAPARYEPIEPRCRPDTGPEGLRRVKERMGDHGLIGLFIVNSCAFGNEEAIYRYYDNPGKHEQWAAERLAEVERRFAILGRSPVKPDFLCVGGSGTFVFQTEEMFRRVAFPAVKRAIALAAAAGYPTHVHSCGPEKRLVEIMATETALTVIDPLEIPPMGDCDLADLKRRFGHKITLKGNLHTTDVMLRGSPDDVRQAARRAIRDGAPGGRFILSTGDQCGRDTPDENLRALVETAEEYGRYRPDGTLVREGELA